MNQDTKRSLVVLTVVLSVIVTIAFFMGYNVAENEQSIPHIQGLDMVHVFYANGTTWAISGQTIIQNDNSSQVLTWANNQTLFPRVTQKNTKETKE